MKLYFKSIIVFLGFLSGSVFAQVPNSFNYQSVVRDASGNPLATQDVNFRITILKGSIDGEGISEYVETQFVTTNDYGLATFQVGKGTTTSGNDISTIDWSTGEHFIQIELDPEGGANFQLMGSSQLLSVPYAFHAKTVENDQVDDADADPENELQELSIEGNTVSLSKGGSIELPATVTGFSGNFTDLVDVPEGLDDGDDTLGEADVVKIVEDNGFVTEVEVEDIIEDKGFLTEDDVKPQKITRSGKTVTLSEGGGSFDLEVYTGARNIEITSDNVIRNRIVRFNIGDNIFGGVVVALDPSKTHGLVAKELDGEHLWEEASSAVTNTSLTGGTTFDWRLPTNFEIQMIYGARLSGAEIYGGFVWSASEGIFGKYYGSTGTGQIIYNDFESELRTAKLKVIAVRAF